MIKANTNKHGITEVEIRGDVTDILADFTSIIDSIHARLLQEMPEDIVNELIVMCGKLAYADSDEEMEAVMDGVTKILEDAIRELEARG